jgi:hypothetical protein
MVAMQQPLPGQTKRNRMDIVLWVLRVSLALKFISVALHTHGIRQTDENAT